jgi:hypothetical protein
MAVRLGTGFTVASPPDRARRAPATAPLLSPRPDRSARRARPAWWSSPLPPSTGSTSQSARGSGGPGPLARQGRRRRPHTREDRGGRRRALRRDRLAQPSSWTRSRRPCRSSSRPSGSPRRSAGSARPSSATPLRPLTAACSPTGAGRWTTQRRRRPCSRPCQGGRARTVPAGTRERMTVGGAGWARPRGSSRRPRSASDGIRTPTSGGTGREGR